MKLACPNKKQYGFTLIELLVSIGILLLMIGLSLISYFDFNNRQKLTQAQELVRESVADVQNSARSGKMRGCSALLHYEINFSFDNVTITPVCRNSSEIVEESLVELPEGIVFDSALTLYVKPVSGLIYSNDSLTTPANASLIVELDDESQQAELSIDHSGSVTEVEE